jgi:hypothetical protein
MILEFATKELPVKKGLLSTEQFWKDLSLLEE